MKKDIIDILDLKKGDVLSIVGSGGKTTTMYSLGEKLKENNRVLLTTSTKIGRPKEGQGDKIYGCVDSYISDRITNVGSYIIGNTIKGKGKFAAISNDEFNLIKDDFDISIIEADGCKNLPLKGWRDKEPVILNGTNKTLGLFSIKVLDKEPSYDLVFAIEELEKITGKFDIISKEIFEKIILSENGIFKHSLGDKYIFFNQTDSIEEKNKAIELIEYLKSNKDIEDMNIKFLYGSVKKDEFYEG